MKIAIPSNDNTTISNHFGRAKGFTICEVNNNEIINAEYIQNTFTKHAQKSHTDKEHNHKHHNHDGIFKALGDCEVIIAGRMGECLYNEFEQKNIDVFITSERNIENALNLFLKDNLDNNLTRCCNH